MTNLNNPGYLLINSYHFQGEALESADPDYKQFYEVKYAVRGVMKQISLIINIGHKALEPVVNVYTNFCRTTDVNMLEYVKTNTGFDNDKEIDIKNKSDIKSLALALITYQTNENISNEVLEEAYFLAINNMFI
jgi:hypothetical protein